MILSPSLKTASTENHVFSVFNILVAFLITMNDIYEENN